MCMYVCIYIYIYMYISLSRSLSILAEAVSGRGPPTRAPTSRRSEPIRLHAELPEAGASILYHIISYPIILDHVMIYIYI